MFPISEVGASRLMDNASGYDFLTPDSEKVHELSSSNPNTPEPETSIPSPRFREFPGQLAVVGMFLLGIASTVVIYVYWDQHTKPYRPLTEAIGREFKYSLPKVEGGRHKKGPVTLRIAMRVPFSPEVDDPAARDTLSKLRGLIRQHTNVNQFERIQIHLIHIVPEETAKTRTFELLPAEILDSTVPQ